MIEKRINGRFEIWSRLGWISSFFLLLGLLLSPQQAPASKGASEEGSQGPIQIKSDKMEVVDKSGTVLFTGQVRATRGDMVINSDSLKVFYKQVDQEGKKVIREIRAVGHVRITRGDMIATGKKARYLKPQEKLVLTGDVQVWQGKNRVSGHQVVLFLNEDRSIVEKGPGGRVEAVVYPAE